MRTMNSRRPCLLHEIQFSSRSDDIWCLYDKADAHVMKINSSHKGVTFFHIGGQGTFNKCCLAETDHRFFHTVDRFLVLIWEDEAHWLIIKPLQHKNVVSGFHSVVKGTSQFVFKEASDFRVYPASLILLTVPQCIFLTFSILWPGHMKWTGCQLWCFGKCSINLITTFPLKPNALLATFVPLPMYIS